MGVAEDLQEKWEGLLQWSDEKGLPLRGISESLEEKGIPAMPFFVLLFLLAIGGIFYFAFAAGKVSVFAPSDATILITLKDSTGLPVKDASVILTSATADQPNIEDLQTDSSGRVTIPKVKIGSRFTVSAIDNEGSTLAFEEDQIAVSSTEKTFSLSLLAPILKETVSLSVDVKVPEGEALESATVWLYDSTGIDILDSKQGLRVSFNVGKATNYVVKVRAQGYNDGTLQVAIRDADDARTITLQPKGRDPLGKLRVRVTDAETGKVLNGVSIEIQNSDTAASIFKNLKTGENGEIDAIDTLKIGLKVKVLASLQGYAAAISDEKEVAENAKVEVSLQKISEAEMKAIRVVVKDSNGAGLSNPVVKLWDSKNAKRGELNPPDGVAVFNDVGSEAFFMTAIKPGYLPAFVQDAVKGNTYELKLTQSNEGNAAKAKVQVENQNGDAVPQAPVSLYYDDGFPLGTAEKISGNDGIAFFDDLPQAKVYARASYNGRLGSSGIVELSAAGTGEEEKINLLKVQLKPAKGRVAVQVKDHFSGKVIEGAKVEFSPSDVEFSAVASCTTKSGRCTASLQEGFYVATVSANNYDLFTTSEFEVRPNADNKVNIGIISSEIAEKTKVVYQGVFNLKGEAVNSLSPSTIYVAKFTLNRPNVKITRAELQVRLGNAGTSLENEAAEIIGYDAVGAIVTKGATAEEGTQTVAAEVEVAASVTPTASASLNLESISGESSQSPTTLAFAEHDTTDQSFKFVHFDFQPFEGSREVAVQFRTRATASGRVDLQFRSAFFTEKEALRDPIDNNAPRGAFLANMHSQASSISFEGTCESGLCLQANFEGASGAVENNFEAGISETFNVKFKVIAPRGSVVELSAPLGGDVIALAEGTSGNAKAILKTTEDTQLLSLATSQENAEGSFSLQARRLANNVDLQLKATSGGNSISKSLSLRIVGEKPDLKVSYTVIVDKGTGKILKALQQNKIVFTVLDSLDLPVKNAFVSLGNGNDALGGTVLEAQMQEAADGEVTYLIDGASPLSVGSVGFKVSAEGFKQRKGSIQVQANTLFSADSRTLSLSVSSNELQQEPFSVQNLLANELKVTYSVISPSAKYTDIQLEFQNAKLKAGESKVNGLQAALSDAILKISANPQALKERVQGKILVTAKLGSSEQEASIPFVINTDYRQENLNSLWEVSTDSVDFALQPPALAQDSEAITVTNTGPYPIIVNHQTDVQGAYIMPLSLTLEPGASGDFTFTASASSVDSCRFEDEAREGKIDFFASTNGVISKKSASAAILISSSENCRIADALRVSLPVSLTAQLPASTRTKYNADGSLLVELPSGERFLFNQGAQLTSTATQYTSYQNAPAFPGVTAGGGSFVVVPPGVFIEAPPQYIRQSSLLQPIGYAGFSSLSLSPFQRPFATQSYQLNFPFTTYLDFDPETEFSQSGTQKIASIEDFDVYFPASVPLVRGRSVKERRATLPPNAPISIQLTPFVNSQGSIEVYFPVDATFVIQERVRIRTDDFTGARALQFPSGTTISLPADARFSQDTAATGGGGDLFNELRRITIPAGSAVRIPPPYAIQGPYGDVQLQLPFRIQFSVPKSERISLTLDAGGIEARTISTEIYEVSFPEGTTRVGIQFADGSRTIEAAALAPISIRPTDFGVVGIKKKLPIALTLKLPSTASVKRKGALAQIEFENGNRMLLENPDITEKEFEEKEVRIQANSEITFSANAPESGGRMIEVQKSDFGTESFTIYVPVQAAYHFPLANAGITQKRIVTNNADGYEAEFLAGNVNFVRTDNFNDINLQPSDSIKGVRFTQVDPQLSGVDFEFQFSFPVTAEIPEASFLTPKLEPYKQKSREVFHSFRLSESAEVKLSDPDTKDEFWFLANRLLAKEYDFASADFLSDPRKFEIPLDTLIVPNIPKDDDGKYKLHAKFGTELAVTIPASGGDYDEKAHSVDLKGCKNVEVKVRDRAYTLPGINEIKFPENSRKLPGDAADLEAPERILVPPGEEIVFNLCPRKPGKDAFGSAEDAVRALVAFEWQGGQKPNPADKTLELKFDDGNADQAQERFICVQNYGFSNLNVFLNLDGDLGTEGELPYRAEGYTAKVRSSVSSELGDALKSVTRPEVWEQGKPSMLLQTVPPETQKCERQSFKLQLGVPEQYLDEDGCIKEAFRKYTTDPSKAFVTVYGEYNGKTVSEQIGVQISLDKSAGTCKGGLTRQFREMMGGFFVNYADDPDLQNKRDNSRMKLFFKGPSTSENVHKRAFAVINNLDEDVAVSFSGAALEHVNFASKPLDKLGRGMAQIVIMQSRKATDGVRDLLVTGKGAKSGTVYTRFISVEVNPLPAELEGIYSSTPLGDLAPPEEKKPAAETAAAPKTTEMAAMDESVFASDEKISFAGESTAGAAIAIPSELPKEAMLCQTNFCTSEQAEASFKAFVGEFKRLVDAIGGTEQGKFGAEISKFCNAIAKENNGNYIKSIVVQTANAETELNGGSIATDMLKDWVRSSDGKLKVSGDTIKGCGVHVLQGRLNICTPAPPHGKEDFLKGNAEIEFKVAATLPCDETIANAGLLTAEEPEVIVGREQNSGLGFGDSGRENGNDFFSGLQLISLGSYKRDYDAEDFASAQALTAALYGSKAPYVLTTANTYDSPTFCAQKFVSQSGKLLLVETPVLAAAVGVNYLTLLGGGAANVFKLGTYKSVLQAGYSIAAAGAVCAAVAFQALSSYSLSGKEGKQTEICDAANDCLLGQIFGATDFVIASIENTIPGAGKLGTASLSSIAAAPFQRAVAAAYAKDIVRRFGEETATYMGVGLAARGVENIYNAFSDSDEWPHASVPLVIAGGKAIRPAVFGTRAFLIDALMRNGKTITTATKVADNILKNYGSTVQAGFSRQQVTDAVFTELKRPYLGFNEKQAREIAEQASRTGRYRLITSLQKGQRLATAGRAVSVLARIIVPLLFHVDVRPVRAEMDYRYANHLIVYNSGKTSGFDEEPSIQSICARNYKEAGECLNEVSALNLCPNDREACVYLVEAGDLAGTKGYMLVSAVNELPSPKKFFEGLFVSSAVPQKSAVDDAAKVRIVRDVLDRASLSKIAPVSEKGIVPTEVSQRELATTLYEIYLEACNKNACSEKVENALPKVKEKLDSNKWDEAFNDLQAASLID